MRTAEIAQRYLSFFEKRGHLVVPSASLISPNPTTLFTIAGMVPFIPYLLGEQTPPSKRMASMQKCVRTLDIEEVGKTTRHGTFFQMLGNFSFGDYFKESAIPFAWELLTTPQDEGGLGFDPEVLWVTTYTDDDQARAIWEKVGMNPSHMQVLGMEDNFWTTGGPGPGGPCSEIFVDRGPEFGREGGPSADENRYIEIWDLVFENYEVDNVKSKTDLHIVGELENKNIDTGMGLERVAYLLQGKQNIYETDEVFPVIEAAQKLSGRIYGKNEKDDIQFRIVADHVRSALMIMSDGVRPSNEGRGYVLRRLLRRTIRSMKTLGVDSEVLPTLFPVSKAAMAPSYPDLNDSFEEVSAAAYGEEAAFRRTLDKGTQILNDAVEGAKKNSNSHDPVISGEQAFKLHDTYGFPIELTLEMAGEQDVKVDEDAFHHLMSEQKNRARADALKKRHNSDVSVYDDVKKQLTKPQEFLGYQELTSRARVLNILKSSEIVQTVSAPADIEVILDQTPFYAEKGGQLPDEGEILSDKGAVLEVDDVQTPIKNLTVHRARLTEGTLSVGELVTASVDQVRRAAIGRAHTATHILHKALREILGPQATQRGSENAPDRLRFDFQWPKAVTKEQLSAVEARVNERIRDDLPISAEYMPYRDAVDKGADHLFGEKYSDEVRVVTIGDGWSCELCGGTHLHNTGQVGSMTIISQSSVGTGVRRIEALVGEGSYHFNADEHQLVNTLAESLGSQPNELVDRVSSLHNKVKELQNQLAKVYEEQLSQAIPQLVEQAPNHRIGEVQVVSANVGSFGSVGALRTATANIRERLLQINDDPSVVVLAGIGDNNNPMIMVATNEAARSKGIKAGDIVKSSSKILGGGGGGKPDFAQGGGTDSTKIDEALKNAYSFVKKLLQ